MKQILGDRGTYNLAPIKYKWAWKMLERSLKNNWHPNEIGIGDDLATYPTLSTSEKHVFTSVFATLTTSDMCVQRNLAVCVYEAIAAPEITAFIGNQIKEEVVHSITYQYVIEHLGLDEDYIYNLYKNVPEIRQKFELAAKYAEYLVEYQATKDINKLLEGLVFYYVCFEGGWFYNGFSPIFALARRNLMKGAAEQLQYIMRDEHEHCLFGLALIKNIMTEYSHELTQEKVTSIVNEAVTAEKIYAEYAMPSITGYNAKTHIKHLKHVLDNRVKALGFAEIYGTPSQLDWLDEMIFIKKEKNFFESRVTEYQTSSGLFNNFVPASLDEIDKWNLLEV